MPSSVAPLSPRGGTSSSNSSTPGTQKIEEDKIRNRRLQLRLHALCSKEANQACFDCGVTGVDLPFGMPSHGTLVCLRCSCIHRALTGIELRSITLDEWHADEIAFMERNGNAKCRETWESGLPDGFVRPSEDNELMKRFITNKWIAEDYRLKTTSDVGDFVGV